MDSFGAKSLLTSGGHQYTIYRLAALEQAGFAVKRLPFSLKILLEISPENRRRRLGYKNRY